MTVWTIGHGTRPLELFLALLHGQGVTHLVDTRTVPRSRRNPQYSRETLPGALRAAGVGYTHLPDLGGLRHPRRDSVNTAWRNAAFRGYADHMQTTEFAAGLEALLALATPERVAVMCAETVPWRCHRSLIADALTVRGVRVEHLLDGGAHLHRVTPWARVDGRRVTYPGPPAGPAP
jgi:uncharacterized protein (DUF488 family)